MGNSLIDTGFLFAVFDARDLHHEKCTRVFSREIVTAILPDVVIPELAYLILREMDVQALVEFLRAVENGEYRLDRTTISELERAAEILEKYYDNKIDLVDAVIVTMAERLSIEKILTVDRRHFGAFAPRHCAAFRLLPG